MTSNPGVPCTEVLPVVAYSIIQRTGVERRLRRGRSRAYGRGPPRPAVSWKNGPARAADRAAVNAPARPTVPAAGNRQFSLKIRYKIALTVRA